MREGIPTKHKYIPTVAGIHDAVLNWDPILVLAPCGNKNNRMKVFHDVHLEENYEQFSCTITALVHPDVFHKINSSLGWSTIQLGKRLLNHLEQFRPICLN